MTENTTAFAVVTGASSGIGLELARQCTRHGFDVLACAENVEIHAAATSLSADGAVVVPLQADLADYEGVEQLVGAIGDRPVDALIVNAGIGNGGPFIESSLEDDLRLIALNVTSAVHLTKRLLPAMAHRGSGRVLITSSIAATMPGPYYATYAASKSFLLSFAEAVRHELKDSGVTVTALMPGPTDTAVDEGKKDDAAKVAEDGFEAMMAGADKVVAGAHKNAAQAALAKLLPESVRAAIHARMAKPKDE